MTKRNRLLDDYRMDIAHTTWRDRKPTDWLAEATERVPWVTFPWSDEEVEHARKVLTRLEGFKNND